MKNILFKTSFLSVLLFIVSCSLNHSEAFGDLVADQAWTEIENGALAIDVRSSEDFNAGHIKGAINIPHDQIELRLSEIKQKKDQPIVVYCKSGRRAAMAEEVLKEHGFSRVINGGGYADMKEAERRTSRHPAQD